MRTLAMSIMILAVSAGAQGGSLAADTAAQHHEWSRKFALPADPAITTAIDREVNVEVGAELCECPCGALRSTNLPASAGASKAAD